MSKKEKENTEYEEKKKQDKMLCGFLACILWMRKSRGQRRLRSNAQNVYRAGRVQRAEKVGYGGERFQKAGKGREG